MGNTTSLNTDEDNEGAGVEAMDIFKALDVNADEAVSAEEWEKAFQSLDADDNGLISRKEWYLKAGTTDMYDAIHKKSSAQITREEWQEAFELLDTNKDGKISVQEWLSRRRVRLGFIPIGMTLNNWGVAVGDRFYEVLSSSVMNTEMVVAGPEGILALGDFAKAEGAKETWLETYKADIEEGKKPKSMWLEAKGEPRARQGEEWQDFEMCGWTMKSDEEIDAWVQEWAAQHPEYKGMDPFGRECNDQTFAIDMIGWLTDTNFSRMSDNTKGRAVVYGGLALLATAGGLYIANKARDRKSVV